MPFPRNLSSTPIGERESIQFVSSPYKSFQSGLSFSINSIFHCRFHFFIRFKSEYFKTEEIAEQGVVSELRTVD
jgi:hypothetical protein